MKIEVHRLEFLRALQRSASVVDRKSTMTILGNILLSATKAGGLVIAATDLGIGLVAPCQATVLEDGAVTVPSKGFVDIVKNLPSDMITVSVNPETFRVMLKCGKVEYKIIGTSAADYPKIPRPADFRAEFFPVEQRALLDMIDKTLFSVSTDETRFHLNGIFFVVKDQRLRLVSTDGHRLSIVDRAVSGIDAFSPGVIVPRKGLLEIKKLLEDKEEAIEMAIKGSNVYVQKGDILLTCKLIDAQYPDYEQVIPKSAERSAVIHRQQLAAALHRISILSSAKAYGVKMTFSKDTLCIESDNQDFGEGKEELEIEFSGRELTVGFNAHYLMDVLNATESVEIKLQVNDEISPGVIVPVDDENYKAIIMPMRI